MRPESRIVLQNASSQKNAKEELEEGSSNHFYPPLPPHQAPPSVEPPLEKIQSVQYQTRINYARFSRETFEEGFKREFISNHEQNTLSNAEK